MWTGISALRNIDQSLQTIRNEVVRLDSQLSQLTNSVTANQRRRVNIIRDIAGVRLSEIDSGELRTQLTAADHDAAQILEQREEAILNLNGNIEQLNVNIESLESERQALLESVNQTSQQIAGAEQEVQNQLKVDTAYLKQFAIAGEAESIAQEADHKVEQAQLDMAEKAQPYQADQLFMYLWEQAYGTTEYSSGFFARFVDGWVARLIKYEPARINYWNLTEIPKRLQEHADSVNRRADEAHMALQQLELDALKTRGVNKLETDLQSLRTGLDSKDDEIEAAEVLLNEKLNERADFVSGRDEFIQRCVNRLTQSLEHKNLNSVHRYVRETHSPTDDRLVIELQELDDALDHVEDDLRDVRKLHNARLTKLQDLEQVRRKFKNSRFDDVRSGFGNESLLASVLAQFVQGAISGNDLWGALKRNQRYRNVGSRPDFGSGGLGSIGDILGGAARGQRGRRGRRKRSSTWHFPSPRGGGGGFKMPRSSGRSGGGFKTGGGF